MLSVDCSAAGVGDTNVNRGAGQLSFTYQYGLRLESFARYIRTQGDGDSDVTQVCVRSLVPHSEREVSARCVQRVEQYWSLQCCGLDSARVRSPVRSC